MVRCSRAVKFLRAASYATRFAVELSKSSALKEKEKEERV